MDEEKNKKNNYLDNFGNTSSGGGFIPYSVIVVDKIVAALIAITVLSIIIKLRYKNEFKRSETKTDCFTMIELTMFPGRTKEQKARIGIRNKGGVW